MISLHHGNNCNLDEPIPEVASSPAVPRKVYGDNPTPDSEIILKIVVGYILLRPYLKD